MKVDALTGPYLSYWAERAVGTRASRVAVIDGKICVTSSFPIGDAPSRTTVDYAEAWELAGALIEEHKISVVWTDDFMSKEWGAEMYTKNRRVLGLGPTFVIAAMRAFVASVYGDKVPDFKADPEDSSIELAP